MRVQAADATIESMMKHKTFFSAIIALSDVVKCEACSARLHKAFKAALYAQHAQGWRWDLEEG